MSHQDFQKNTRDAWDYWHGPGEPTAGSGYEKSPKGAWRRKKGVASTKTDEPEDDQKDTEIKDTKSDESDKEESKEKTTLDDSKDSSKDPGPNKDSKKEEGEVPPSGPEKKEGRPKQAKPPPKKVRGSVSERAGALNRLATRTAAALGRASASDHGEEEFLNQTNNTIREASAHHAMLSAQNRANKEKLVAKALIIDLESSSSYVGEMAKDSALLFKVEDRLDSNHLVKSNIALETLNKTISYVGDEYAEYPKQLRDFLVSTPEWRTFSKSMFIEKYNEWTSSNLRSDINRLRSFCSKRK